MRDHVGVRAIQARSHLSLLRRPGRRTLKHFESDLITIRAAYRDLEAHETALRKGHLGAPNQLAHKALEYRQVAQNLLASGTPTDAVAYTHPSLSTHLRAWISVV